MDQNRRYPEVSADDFARRFSMRNNQFAWLLGAGASASAGVPTASEMIWDFKKALYVSQRRISPKTLADETNPAIRNLVQTYFDTSGSYPGLGEADEYAAFFEAAFPSETDRRIYLEGKLTGARPGYGHLALATLMKGNQLNKVWTTNFDTMLADACASVYGTTSALTVADLDAPILAAEALAEKRWPLEIKLHGDFRSRRLKNTNDELRDQDARLRQLLIQDLQTSGLIVIGYSGRDGSIMDALNDALDEPSPYSSGVFWFQRGEGEPPDPVIEFLRKAEMKGVETGLVRIENFDEALRDLIRVSEDLDTEALNEFQKSRRRWSAPARSVGKRGWPIIRLNALEILERPSVCRLVDCSIGNTREVRYAADTAEVDLIVARTQAGVLAFGRDNDVRSAFEKYSIKSFDLYTLEDARMRRDTSERGLVRAALARAISRNLGLAHLRRYTSDLFAPVDPDAETWAEL